MAAPPSNYWDPRTTCYHDILTIARVGTSYRYEDVVRHAWLQLLTIYFPPYTTNGRLHGIHGGYRGRVIPSNAVSLNKPDLVIVQMACTLAMDPQGLPDANVPDRARDVLWVECKAPCEDTPSGWKELMKQAGDRLIDAHPDRMLYVILAIGLKWMFFKWDPSTAGPPLQVQGDNNAAWTMTPGYHYEPAVFGQSHVTRIDAPDGPSIDTNLAYSLDFFTLDPQSPQQPLNASAVQLLERCLRHVQDMTFY